MATVSAEVVVEVPARELWEAMADVGAVHRRMLPGRIAVARIDGDTHLPHPMAAPTAGHRTPGARTSGEEHSARPSGFEQAAVPAGVLRCVQQPVRGGEDRRLGVARALLEGTDTGGDR